jgi:hypothetical protein
MNMRHRRLNGWRRLVLMPVLLLALLMLVLAGSYVGPSTAYAQSGVTITVASTGKLIARTIVRISTTFTCTVPANSTFQAFYGSVTIQQVSHGVVIFGGGGFNYPDFTNCDGTAHTIQIDVSVPSPTPFSPPFHGGPAVANGNINVQYYDPSSGQFQNVGESSGDQAIQIKG